MSTETPAAIVRPARPDDLAAIAAIYGHHVLTGLATFELVPPSAEEMARRFAAIVEAGLPWLVAEEAGRVVGYAYAGPWRPRPAYRHTVEDSVYLAPDAQGRGIGRALLAAVIAACEAGGFRQMIAVIGDSANAASIGLHRALGFRAVGTLQAVGFKFGRFVDTVTMQRALGPGDTIPPE